VKYFLIAGEASGDLHASRLMQSLLKADPAADFRYFGGDLMQAVGGTLIRHYREMAYMGFLPVLTHLRTIFRNMELCKQAIRDYQPDTVILVDYPGFNLRMAEYLKSKPFLASRAERRAPFIVYYISPKIWAWKEYRIRAIRKFIDRMLCILPFELEFYQKRHYEVTYVGNPTVDAIAGREYASETFEEFTRANRLTRQPVIALLAGSRKQEIRDNLPTMLEAAAPFDDFQLVIAGAPGVDPDYYKPFTDHRQVKIVFGQTYRLLQQSRAALVTSGTATLETALLRIPQTVCYRLPFGTVSSFVFQHFFSCKYISLVNLIADRSVVKELFGKNFSVRRIREELDLLLNDNARREKMQQGYQTIIDRLGPPEASDRAAMEIVSYVADYKKK
jgi:lipid-A-disaccharide synthase